MACAREQELREAATSILDQINGIIDELVAAMKRRDDQKLLAIDQRMEELVGEKERSIGALFGHRREHGC